MKLAVHVLGREVAILEQVGDFKSVVTYHAGTAVDDVVSRTMPVRTESYGWDDQLPPVFQMNLPEGYLLQVLQEQFGPHVGASPAALLSVIGRNMVGRLQVAAPGAKLDAPAKPVEVQALLQGDNAEEAFAELVREHATSGVSGVVPKFLDAQKESIKFSPHKKATLLTRRHIIKGSSGKLPFAALNEYFCMQVASQVMATARTQVSKDGMALVVDRFDGDFMGGAFAFVFIGDAQDARIDCINEMGCCFARGRNAAHGDALTLAGEVKWWIFVERSIAIVVDLSCVGGARNSLRDRPRARIGICLWNRVNTHGIK